MQHHETIAQTFPWGDSRRYYSYSHYFRNTFGERVQKLSIDAGFTCPNRDGALSVGGCSFCNNDAFNPSYCQPQKSITQQIDEGIAFHQWRYRKSLQYLAYFQAYSNTYAPLSVLRSRYEEALSHPLITGLVIGTRPDCVDDEKLDYIASLAKEHYVAIEYGIESCYDKTLSLINRGHTFGCTAQAVRATAQRSIHCGGHLILGLPNESREEMIAEVALLNALPLNTVKFHQLQVLKGSLLEQQMLQGTIGIEQYAIADYITMVCDIVEHLRPTMVIERFAGEVPPRYQACPERSWRREDGRLIRNEEIPTLVEKELQRRDSWQGKKYIP